jgi:hypothetical protein
MRDQDWIVLDTNGNEVECFSGQIQAIDFAERLRKQQRLISVIDLQSRSVRLIEQHITYRRAS